MFVVCAIVLAFADFTISGTVKDGDGNGIDNAKVTISNISSGEEVRSVRTGDGGGYSFNGLVDGVYEVSASFRKAEESVVVPLSGADLFNIDIILPIRGRDPTETPTPIASIDPVPTIRPTSTVTPTPWPTPIPHSNQPSGQVKYAQASYNMYPIIQMNTSWKRASRFEPITFDSGDTYDPDGFIKLYEWTFGDGSMTEGKVVEHAFKEEGRYTVRLRVLDNNGAERSAYVTAIISNKPPVAVPGNDTNATVGGAVWFNGSGSYDPDGKVVKYEWSFGDGTTGQGEAVMHTYARPDKYKAELKVTDDSGANATAYRTVNVSGAPATPAQAKSEGSQGILLLAGAGIACVALIFLTRKKGK